jgi:CDP-paratose 2-epimerase
MKTHSTHGCRPRRLPVLITGGAGFIGTNVADRLLTLGAPVRVFDNLSRPGVERNLHWLSDRHPTGLQFENGDIRDRDAIRHACARWDRSFTSPLRQL